MLCALPYPHLGRLRPLQAYAWCVRRGTIPCSHSPVPPPETGRRRVLPSLPLDLTCKHPPAAPGTTSPARYHSITCPTKTTTATAPAGTASKVGRGPFQILRPRQTTRLPSQLAQSHTEFVSVLSKNQTPLKKKKKKNPTGMSIITNAADLLPAPMCSTCILKAFTPTFWCIFLTQDIKSNALSSLPSTQLTRCFISTSLVEY